MVNSDSIMAIVPAYNEEGRIGKTLDQLIPMVESVVVIDDGSMDNTLEEIRSRTVKIISYAPNKGKGYAIRRGIKYFLTSDADIAIFIDGDGQHDPADIPRFRKKFNENSKLDVVMASRFGTDQWINNMPFLRKISNLLSRFGLWILYNGFIIEDPQNGYRAYHRRAIEKISFKSNNYSAETEILIDAYMKGCTFDKVIIESVYNEESHSKFSLFMDTWTIPGIMVKEFFRRKPFLIRKLRGKN